MFRNRYFVIIKDGENYAYLSVKKDFYTEGYLIDDEAILIGYFNMYQSLDVHIFNGSNKLVGNSLNGMTIISKDRSDHIDVDGKTESSDYQLYRAILDEYCNHLLGEKIDCKIQIKQIVDKEIIQNINYLIRSNLRKLTGFDKQYYEMLKRHRYGNLKELLSGIKFLFDEDVDLGISSEVIKDLEEYLNCLNPNLEKKNANLSAIKDKQKVNKKKVKKRDRKR